MNQRKFIVTLSTDTPEPFIKLANQSGFKDIVVAKTHIHVDVEKIEPRKEAI